MAALQYPSLPKSAANATLEKEAFGYMNNDMRHPICPITAQIPRNSLQKSDFPVPFPLSLA